MLSTPCPQRAQSYVSEAARFDDSLQKRAGPRLVGIAEDPVWRALLDRRGQLPAIHQRRDAVVGAVGAVVDSVVGDAPVRAS